MTNSPYHSALTRLKRSFSLESFDKYFLHSPQNFNQLTKTIKECNLDDLHCRFNVWRLTLGVVSVQSSQQQKRAELQDSRAKYQQKKDEATKAHFKKSPIKQPVKKNPLLMMGSTKPQQNKEAETDQFLKQEIHKDVERTYQEMPFFQEKAIMKLLDLLLFVWCRRNPEVSYKQGMNELLASVVVCYFKEAQFKTKEQKPQHVDEKLWEEHLFFNSVEHAESDIFSVFQKIIDVQGDMYKTEADLTIKSKVNPNSKNNTPILQRIIQIKDHKLKQMDLELFRILKLQDVQTKSFMLRWIRCMHTREFDLDNSFTIWDSIFLEFLESESSRKNNQFEFIDAMCLAMFMYMRSIIFTKETAGEILQVYQKYPQLKRGAYLEELITLAWTICQELIESHNNLNNQNTHQTAQQSNWFEDNSKVKALHFMEKKPQKKSVQVELKPTPHAPKKQDVQIFLIKPHSEKQLKDHITEPAKKPVESQKKHEEQSHTKSTPNTSAEDSLREAFVQNVETTKQQKHEKPEKTQKTQKPVKEKQHSLPSPFHTKQASSSSKIAQNSTVTLTGSEITQILQNLNECLGKIRDIDAQSLIRRTIKKIQGKVKPYDGP